MFLCNLININIHFNEGMCKSLINELRFKIGEQYELNEFNLKTLDSTFNNGLEYENYEYLKDDVKTLFGLRLLTNVILQYNADILSGIIYKLALNDLDNLITRLNSYLSIDKKLDTEKFILGKTFTVFIFQEFSVSLDIEKDIKLRVIKSLG